MNAPVMTTPSPRAKEEAVRRVNVRCTSRKFQVVEVIPIYPTLYELALSIDREGVVFTEEERQKARDWLEEFPCSPLAPLLRKIAGAKPVDPLLLAARKAAASIHPHSHDSALILDGERDGTDTVQSALAALRGMELAQQSGEAK